MAKAPVVEAPTRQDFGIRKREDDCSCHHESRWTLQERCACFLKDPDGYGTKKNPGRPRQLKTHNRTRLRPYAATGEYTANELQKELCIDTSVRTVQRELQRCEHLAYEKANKSPCMTERHMKLCAEWVERRLRNRTDWSRAVFSDEEKFNLDGPDGCKYYSHDLRSDKKITWSRHSGDVMGYTKPLHEVRLCPTSVLDTPPLDRTLRAKACTCAFACAMRTHMYK